ncbi:MAG: 3-isopropylmalate dehydratase large subunit [Kiloniellales bacterium]|nr:3-isopropylmalate dehydratase large subunit [Kiloniellales bacterium]
MATTLFDKIWNAHSIATRPDGLSLLFVDRHLVHDATAQAFDAIEELGLKVRRPDLTIGTADHYVNTLGALAEQQPALAEMTHRLLDNARRSDFTAYGFGDPRQGIVHVIGPELGFTLPGTVLVCGDSHTASHGALGALAFGIGTSEVAHVLATQTIWQAKPKQMRISIDGALGPGITAKDVVLEIIRRIGADGGTGYAIEYTGDVFGALSVEGRLTICNMSIEAGARSGLVAPDDTTLAYLKGRPMAPSGGMWDRAVKDWQALRSDADAAFDREISIDGRAIEPIVTWGTSPEQAAPISHAVPDPRMEPDPLRRKAVEKALAYMDLKAGTALSDIAIDRVFIGSCTNSRLEDLRAAARIARGRHAKVPAMVVPGSGQVKRQAEAEGLDRVFRAAGFEWRQPGCSMCVAMNGDAVPPGERCASTSNRNFAGRQGPEARTHLLSPPMAAAAAITGRLTDVRKLGFGE